MEQLFQELINLVKTASPMLWEMAHRQLIVQSIIDTIMIGFVVGIAVLMNGKRTWVMNKAKENRYWEDEIKATYWSIFVISSLVATAVTLINISELVGRLINPDFYAIKILMDFVR